MFKLIPIKDAAEQFGLNPQTIWKRLRRDEQAGKNLGGCKKIGRDWFVTEEYIRNREWRNQKNVRN